MRKEWIDYNLKLTQMLLFLDLNPLILQGLMGGGLSSFPCFLLVLLLLLGNVLPFLSHLDHHSLAQCFPFLHLGHIQELIDSEHSFVIRSIYIVSLSGQQLELKDFADICL